MRLRDRRALIPLAVAGTLLAAGPAHSARRVLLNSVNPGGGTFLYPSEFQAYTDTMFAHGFRTVKLGGEWGLKCWQCAPDTLEFDTEPAPGVYDFSVYFDRLDHAITVKGMKAMVSFHLGGRLDTDPVSPGAQPVLPSFLGADDVMMYRNGAGQDLVFTAGSTKVPRFEKPSVRAAMLDFVTAVVTQFRARYGDSVLYYAFNFSQYAENEYPLIGYPNLADTSPDAAAAFVSWLRQRYATPADVSSAWGHAPAFTSWSQVHILDGQPPPALGAAPRAYLDFVAYREDALGRFLGDVRDRVHAAGGKVMAQYGSVWDSYSSVRGTLGFGAQIAGYDLVVVDDAPEYDHWFSMDYTRTNSPGVAFGNEVDAPCRFGCTSDINTCCYAPTFPDHIDVPVAIPQMKALTLFDAPLDNAVAQGGALTTDPIAADTLRLSLRDLYVHHHDQNYLDGLIAAHHALGGQSQPIAVTVAQDLAPAATLGVPDRDRSGVSLAPPAPNPASGRVSVFFTLVRRESVRLRVFDLQGRAALDLPQGVLAPGAHRVSIDASMLPAGGYVFRLETPSTALGRKVEVVR